MASSINNVTLMGLAGRDGEFKEIGSGLYSFTVATTE